ncbi:hypothetical protein KAM576c_08250 [Enterobacter asburiae]|nr:hypothetical protein KAM576c_08250 [Enterobacter asburiae]
MVLCVVVVDPTANPTRQKEKLRIARYLFISFETMNTEIKAIAENNALFSQ